MRGARTTSTIAMLLGLAACGSDRSVFLEPPDLQNHVAAIVVVHDRTPPRGSSVDLRQNDWRVSIDLDEDARGDIDLLGYDCDLAALELAGGAFSFVRDGGRPLIPPIRTWSSIGNTAALVWNENVDPPDRVQRLRLEGEVASLCAEIAVDVVEIEGETTDPRLMSEDRDGLVVIGSRAGSLYHLDIDARTIVPAYLGAKSSQGLWVSSHRNGAETVFFSSGRRGCLGVGEGDTIREIACFPNTTTATAGSWTFLDGPTDSVDDLSLGILLDGGEMLRFERGAFTNILVEGTTDTGDKGGVSWISPDRILFAGPRQSQLIAFDGTVATTEPIPLGAFDKITSIGGGTARGPIIVTNAGSLFARNPDSSWGPFGSAPMTQARRVTRLGDRHYVGGESAVAEVLADGTACPTAVNTGGDVRRLITVGPHIIVTTDPPVGGGFARVFILTPQIPEERCP